jgi:hypothetical protein
MANLGARHRPNVLFNLAGVILMVAGAALAIYGVVTAFRLVGGVGPSTEQLPVGIVDGMTQGFWGLLVLTFGRYLWRGARTRGVKDRFGRVLIIAGYALIGVALDRGMHSAVDLWSSGPDQDAIQAVVTRSLIIVCVFGFPGAGLAAIGFKLAKEKALAQAEVSF